MSLVVQKFGGTSVADTDRIRAVADHVARSRRADDEVVVVVSAMGKTTDELVRLAAEVSFTQPTREVDMLLSAGERISMALLCMALADLEVTAQSFTGSQAGIITDNVHTRAKIIEIRAERLLATLASGGVPVVAGFQGVSTDRNITTLGRGGSAATGGRVLSLRSVEFARNHHVPLHVRSSFTWEPGTWIDEEDETMEQAVVTAVTHDATEAKVTVAGLPNRPGVAARLFRALADRNVSVDMIVQNASLEGTTAISFTVPGFDLAVSTEVSEALIPELGATGVTSDSNVARVSLVGAGMKTHPGVTALTFETLAKEGFNIEMISTSSIRISCVVRASAAEEAVRALHAAFDLAG